MSYIFSALASLAVAVLAFILQSVIKDNRELKKNKDSENAERARALENGVICLLRAKLIEYHTKYMGLGCITTHGFDNWNMMYRAYKALGGNGMINHMNEEIDELPIETH